MNLMKSIRLCALLLVLLLALCPLLVACGGTEGDASDSSVAASGNEGTSEPVGEGKYQDASGNYTLDNLGMPAFDFPQKEFRVCVYNNVKQTTYYSEEIGYNLYETTDDVLNDAVKTRNDLIAEKYGVEVVACPEDNVLEAIRQDASAGSHLYDAAMPFMPDCATLAQEETLYDLKDFGAYIHLEAPWWDQSANASLSVGQKLYFTTGDISIMQKITSMALTFNKRLYEEYCAETFGDLYQRVRDHKWTLDVLYEMGRAVAADVDGTAGMTYQDRWGLVTANIDAVHYYLASGESLITKNASDLPVLAIGEQQSSINTAMKVLETLRSGDDWALIVEDLAGQVSGSTAAAGLGVFGENRSLFRTTAFSAVKKLRDFRDADPFGIVPLPLANEGQDTYYTPSSARFAYGICIPKNVPNAEFSAFMVEALCCYAKNTVTPAYYEVTLKYRDSKDSESMEMLDQYVFSNVVYDLGVIYNFGSVSSMFQTLMQEKSNAVASTLESIRSAVELAIDDCVDLFGIES